MQPNLIPKKGGRGTVCPGRWGMAGGWGCRAEDTRQHGNDGNRVEKRQASAAAWFEGRPSSRVRGWRRVDERWAQPVNHRCVEFSSAPRGVRAAALSSPPCNTARGVLPPLSHPDWPVKMGAWSPQTLCVARPSAERLSEVGTCPCTPPCSEMAQRGSREQSQDSFAMNGVQVAHAWLGPLRVPPLFGAPQLPSTPCLLSSMLHL